MKYLENWRKREVETARTIHIVASKKTLKKQHNRKVWLFLTTGYEMNDYFIDISISSWIYGKNGERRIES